MVSFKAVMNGHSASDTSADITGVPEVNHEDRIRVPVLIVGGGPAGLLQAHLLSHLGVRCLIVERYPERLGAPKAHALSPRSLEICRQFGLGVDKIRRIGTPRTDAFWVNFLTDLNGQQVGVLPYERMDVNVLQHTPEMIHNIPQPSFEQFVTDHLAQNPDVDVRKGVTFVSLVQQENEVCTTVEERATGHKFSIWSKYVIGCDGARSKVRSFLGIECEGEDSYETMMTIHFNANLRSIVGDRVGMLHWIMDPIAAGFIIAYDLSGNAVLISNFDAEKHPVETWNEDLCRSVVRSALGRTDVPFDVLSYRPWLLSRKVAKSYRKGNVFLAGDAAHSFPPTGGLGLNSGLADVHNLAFKIAAVLKDQASTEILEQYELERRQVAIVNSMQSVKNGKKIFGLLKSLGVGDSKDIQEARTRLYASINDPDKKKTIDDGVEAQREHFDNLELHIGYVYGSQKIPPNASNYTPKFTPGARLPHTWISINQPTLQPVDISYISELPASEISKRKYSTLDLCDPDSYTLILDNNRQINITSPLVKIKRLGLDFDLTIPEEGEEWVQKAGLRSSGGLLVRPDQHILMVLDETTTGVEIDRAVATSLGWS